MTFQQLSYLLEVARCGSVTRAAEKLYLAQSSVSAAIGSLEKELGYPVFRRVKNGIVPTERGQRVIEYAGQICENLRKMQTPDPTQKKHIRFSAADFMPFNRAFVRLIEKWKDADTVFHWEPGGGTIEAAKKLVTMQLDMAFLLVHTPRILEIETRFASQGLADMRLGEVPVAVELGPGHRLYDQPEICPEELEGDLFVDSPAGTMVYNNYLKGVIRLSPERTVFVNSGTARNLLLQQGTAFGIGIGMQSPTDPHYGIRRVPLKDLTYTVLAAHNPAKDIQPACRDFLDLVKQQLQQIL